MLYSENIKNKEVRKIANAISRINPVELVTATNVDTTKASWVNPVTAIQYYGNPQFNYNYKLLKTVAHQQQDFRTFKHLVRDEIIPETPADEVIKNLLVARLNEAIQATELAASICNGNDAATTIAARNIYGHPSNLQVLNALDRASNPLDYVSTKSSSYLTEDEIERLEKIELSAEDIAYWFVIAIDMYHIRNWTVEVGPQYTAVDVRDKNATGHPIVGIPTKRIASGKKLLELIGHEIECHLRGSENCCALIASLLEPNSPLKPFIPILAKSDNELLYEGVAKMSDVSIGGESVSPMPYATIACDQARRGENFGSIAHTLFGLMYREAELKNPHKAVDVNAIADRAWNATYRIMRGSTDTAKGGYCFSKDYIYMCGYEVAQTLNPKYLDFASMQIKELKAIEEVCELEPKYPRIEHSLDSIKSQLLNN